MANELYPALCLEVWRYDSVFETRKHWIEALGPMEKRECNRIGAIDRRVPSEWVRQCHQTDGRCRSKCESSGDEKSALVARTDAERPRTRLRARDEDGGDEPLLSWTSRSVPSCNESRGGRKPECIEKADDPSDKLNLPRTSGRAELVDEIFLTDLKS